MLGRCCHDTAVISKVHKVTILHRIIIFGANGLNF